MADDMSKLEQLMNLALAEMQEARRFAATGTEKGLEISMQHIANADFYMKQINKELVLEDEQQEADLPPA
jgi:hypothetical protein